MSEEQAMFMVSPHRERRDLPGYPQNPAGIWATSDQIADKDHLIALGGSYFAQEAAELMGAAVHVADPGRPSHGTKLTPSQDLMPDLAEGRSEDYRRTRSRADGPLPPNAGESSGDTNEKDQVVPSVIGPRGHRLEP